MLVGVIIGGIARLVTPEDKEMDFLSFDPEVFFFLLLPPIIFEAGYSLKRKHFFDNFTPIVAYAFIGTLISTFIVGGLTFFLATSGVTTQVDKNNPMESLLFGALISAVDPVATLSIMGSPELQCDQLLYSLVFGESVLNDAIALVLFKTFRQYYDPDTADLTGADIPGAIVSFIFVSVGSIAIGIILGLTASFMYRHTRLYEYPKFETGLLFLFCYLCYSAAEAFGLSGIMAIFFQGILLSHYNSYNLSELSYVTAEQIFATLATVAETLVFLYMGLSVFTGAFNGWNPFTTILMLIFCIIARGCHIFPLTAVVNMCRSPTNQIPRKMQIVLWFVGLRGAIAFALACDMPGPNAKAYKANTLAICIFTTIVCGGVTEKILTRYGMKTGDSSEVVLQHGTNPYETLVPPQARRSNSMTAQVSVSVKSMFKKLDNEWLKPLFGGSGRGGRRGPKISEHMHDEDVRDGVAERGEEHELSFLRDDEEDADAR